MGMDVNVKLTAGFVAGTLVHTREGLRPIDQIRVGDHVLSSPERGDGQPSYKPVISIREQEAQETWFVSWEDPTLLPKLRSGITEKDYLSAYGNGFVVATPNHPFWVVDSDADRLRWSESPRQLGPPYPRQQWVRADHLAGGMSMQLADGGVVNVITSVRVYKTHDSTQGWADCLELGGKGLLIRMTDQMVTPHVSLHVHRFRPGGTPLWGLLENPNQRYADDDPPGNAPDSWYRSKVYNLEVEEFHTCFVDTMGIWVHGVPRRVA